MNQKVPTILAIIFISASASIFTTFISQNLINIETNRILSDDNGLDIAFIYRVQRVTGGPIVPSSKLDCDTNSRILKDYFTVKETNPDGSQVLVPKELGDWAYVGGAWVKKTIRDEGGGGYENRCGGCYQNSLCIAPPGGGTPNTCAGGYPGHSCKLCRAYGPSGPFGDGFCVNWC